MFESCRYLRLLSSYLQFFAVLLQILLRNFRHQIIIIFARQVVTVVRLLGGHRLLEHELLHHGNLLLELAFLLSHELFDLIDHFGVPLRQLQDVRNVELVDNGAALRLLFLELRLNWVALVGYRHTLLLLLFVRQEGHAVEGRAHRCLCWAALPSQLRLRLL